MPVALLDPLSSSERGGRRGGQRSGERKECFQTLWEGSKANGENGAICRGLITSMQPGMLYRTNFQVGPVAASLAPAGSVLLPRHAAPPSAFLQAGAPDGAHPPALNPALAAAESAPPAGIVPTAAPQASLQRLPQSPAAAPSLLLEGEGAPQPGLGPATNGVPLPAPMGSPAEAPAVGVPQAIGIAPAGIFDGAAPVEGTGLPPAQAPSAVGGAPSQAHAASAPQASLPGRRGTSVTIFLRLSLAGCSIGYCISFSLCRLSLAQCPAYFSLQCF